jgi:hypothetical protein
MRKLLKEFLSYIREEKVERKPGTAWQTAGGIWYGKNTSGETLKTGRGETAKAAAERFAKGLAAPTQAKGEDPSTDKKATTATTQPTTTKVAQPQPTAKPDVPQSQEVPMSNAPGNIPPKPLTKGSAARDEQILKDTEVAMESRGFDSPDESTRFQTFTKLWRAFLGAPSYEEQVNAVREMANLKMIEGGASGKKIYMTPTTGLTPKHMCGQAGTAVTKLMNQIIADEGIEIGMRGNAADRALADLSGKHNEAGVAAHLFPSKENEDAYKSVESRYSQLGGDAKAADERNKLAAQAVRNALPQGAKITNCLQVGGVGKTRLKELGIDPKTDPTDILLDYEVGGKKGIMKISAKIYTDPRNITMKNSGVKKAGVDYLGEPEGGAIDRAWPDMLRKYKWTPDTPDEEKVKLKSALKQEYLKKYAGEMEKLANTNEGQKRLLKMWRAVHGCGKNVHTLVINKSTNQSELKSPSHYCEPKIPFKVKYDGVKVVIEMNTGGPQTLQIDLKTEDKGSPKLLFRHIVRDKK